MGSWDGLQSNPPGRGHLGYLPSLNNSLPFRSQPLNAVRGNGGKKPLSLHFILRTLIPHGKPSGQLILGLYTPLTKQGLLLNHDLNC